MGITFSVATKSIPDNSATRAADIKSWLNGLNITTVHALDIEHIHGFFEITVIYV